MDLPVPTAPTIPVERMISEICGAGQFQAIGFHIRWQIPGGKYVATCYLPKVSGELSSAPKTTVSGAVADLHSKVTRAFEKNAEMLQQIERMNK